ncbi:MAG: hypothetical protein JWP35_2606 [Caulobacter sp.]|nr:hypothetical protein [Caulobacter sp.]
MRYLLIAAALLAIAGPARASEWLCESETPTDYGRVTVRLLVSDKGDPMGGDVEVVLGGDYKASSSSMRVTYALTDGGASALGSTTKVYIVDLIKSPPLPTARLAETELTISGVVMRKPWRMYAELRDQPPPPPVKGSAAVGFVGFIPFDEAVNVLATSADHPIIETRIIGDGSIELAHNHATLPTRAEIQPAVDQAYAAARALAAQPGAKCKAAR